MSELLSHLRVVDLTRVLAGPWATQALADFGAEVIKIERPGVGDDTRSWGPPWVGEANDPNAQLNSGYFQSANRGKRSVCVDLTNDQELTQLKELIRSADVLVENYKTGALAKYGLDYQSVSELNPKIVYCSVTGFGQTGPRANEAGYDAMIQGMGGLMSITGVAEGEPGAGPQKVGVAVADLMTGMYALSGIQAALLYREQTGEGQHIDISLFDTQLAWLANQAQNYLVGGEVPQRKGTGHPNIVPYQAMPTADGYMMLAVGNDAQFKRCCDVIGLPDLPSDERFTTNSARVAHREILVPMIETQLKTQTSTHWIAQFNDATVPCGPINDIGQAFDEPQAKARGVVQTLQHPVIGDVPSVANPLKFSKTPIAYRLAPPMLGEHTHNYIKQDGLNE